MRIRLKKGQPSDEAAGKVGGSDDLVGQDRPRLNQRDFLKLAGAALGVGVAAQMVSPPTPVLAASIGDPDATVTGNLYVPNGSVGIGTSEPTTLLQVEGDSSDSVTILLKNDNASAQTTALGLGVNSVAGAWYLCTDIFRNGGDNVSIWGGGSGDIRFYIDSIGLVGIGTISPQESLHINNCVQIDGARMVINGFDGAPGNFWFRTTAAEPQSVFMAFSATAGGSAESVSIAPQGSLGLFVNSSGQVGVATSSPAVGCKLDVGGNVAVMGTLAIDATGTAIKAYYS